MSFGSNHYVPVLKVKRGEKKALQNIGPSLREHMTPLLEIVKRTDKPIDEHLDTAFDKLEESTRHYRRCFLDVREVAPDGVEAAAAVYRKASDEGINFTPVTGISRTVDIVPALEHRANGLALRLTRTEFEKGGLEIKVRAFLGRHDLKSHEIDLIIDVGAVEELIVDGIVALTTAFMQEVPDHESWRTLTLSACAFPMTMGKGVVDTNSHRFIERGEWIAWKSLHRDRQDLRRLPTFSDCAIQHPVGVEGFDFRVMQVSSSIRYTTEDSWLLLKGKSTKTEPAAKQFPVLAAKLTGGKLREYFAGKNHCAGCALMREAAAGAPSLGSAEVWRRLGTIHHISTVIQGVSSLPWP